MNIIAPGQDNSAALAATTQHGHRRDRASRATARHPAVHVGRDEGGLRKGGDQAGAAGDRLLPKLLPCPWSAIDAGRQAWNIAPARSHSWTVLDGLPMPTDQKTGVRVPPSATSERAIEAPGTWQVCVRMP
jgi:hypothetical protein